MNSKLIASLLSVSLLFSIPLAVGDSSPHSTGSIVDNITEAMLKEYIQTIQDFGPRLTGSVATQETAAYIASQFQDLGLTVQQPSWSYHDQEDINIEGVHQGVNHSSDSIFIVCAHHDSVSGSPGADDNGSGTAAVLAAATVLSRYQFEHTIRFVTFSGEEQGLLGSHIYAQEAEEKDETLTAVLNADMIAYTETSEGKDNVKIYDNAASNWITDRAENVSHTYHSEIGLNIVRPGASSGSDHASFWEYGYDAIFFHEYEFNQPNYHSPSDTIDTLDIDYATRVTRLIVGTLIDLADIVQEDSQDPVLSVIKPREGYLYLGNRELFPISWIPDTSIILGNIDIQTTVFDNQSGVKAVEFYIDGVLKHTDMEPPYTYLYAESGFSRRTLEIKAYDNKGNTAHKDIEFLIFSL